MHSSHPTLQSPIAVEAASSAFSDALTGLANRSLFNDRLEHGLALAKRHDLTLAVMFLDLDGFRTINDDYGRELGDALLQTVADRLRENTRDDDTVCRMGVNDAQTVAKLAREIVDCIQDTMPPQCW